EKTARFASQWINEKNLQKPTSKYIPELREYIDGEIKKRHNERTADAQEVMEYLTSVLRGKSKSEIVVIEWCGDGMSSARQMEKAPDEKERLKAAELLGKRFGIFSERINVDAKVEHSEKLADVFSQIGGEGLEE
ncbi:MAG: terminase small subunit, partial [Lachnospiraceae bacterium]|nr:terminase small subunit [Lachnospiraceae bacterium]